MNIKLVKDKIRVDKGGASFSIHLLAEDLTRRGHDVEVITVHFTGIKNHPPGEYSYKLSSRPLGNKTQIDGAAKIYSLLNELDNPDLIHSFQPQLNPVLGAWAKQNPSIATVGRLNSYENFCTDPALIEQECYKNCTISRKWSHHPNPSPDALPKMAFDTWVQPRLLNELDALFALSPAVKEIFEGYGVDNSRLEVIPNFYEESFGTFETNQQLGASTEQDYRILYVGRLVQEKGVDVLLDAVERAKINLAVDIVGDGKELESIRSRASDNVTVHGRVDHNVVADYYEKADVFVHPGLWPEPFGRTILEAMQCGCVPVVSDVGGPPWIVGDAGKTFSKGDSMSLATTLETLADTSVWKSHRDAIHEELERFEPNCVLNRIIENYQKLV